MKTTGQTIFITGGTSGIGLAFAERFLELGNTVILCGRRQDRLDALAARHPGLIALRADVADAASRETLAATVIQRFPAVNILVNNAGIQLATDLTRPVDPARLHAEIETNLVAPIHLASLFASHFAEKADAAIINISSGLAFVPIAFMPVYCATKAAIHSLTLSLRHQLRNTAVKVFEIIPPAVDTELGSDYWAGKSQSHGGLPVRDFLEEAMQALDNDVLEAPVAQAHNLRAKGEALFPMLNGQPPA